MAPGSRHVGVGIKEVFKNMIHLLSSVVSFAALPQISGFKFIICCIDTLITHTLLQHSVFSTLASSQVLCLQIKINHFKYAL